MRRGNGRLRCPLFLRADLQTSHMIFFMLYPLEGDGECLVRMRPCRASLRAPVRSSGTETTAGQEVATEVWTERGTQAAAWATKRSKRAREAGLMS